MVGLRGRCSLQGVFLRCKILSLTTSDSGTSCFLPAVVHPPKSSPPAGTDPRPPTMAHRRQGSGSHVPSEDRQPSFVGDHINDVVPQRTEIAIRKQIHSFSGTTNISSAWRSLFQREERFFYELLMG